MNWYDFADKDDIRAHKLYQKLILSKTDGYGWDNTWVRVPRKAVHHVAQSAFNGDPTSLWTGFEWGIVKAYEGANGRTYVRLPQFGEVSA